MTSTQYPSHHLAQDTDRSPGLVEAHRRLQDVNDIVMQRLFATGVGLQALAGQLADAELADCLRRHIADLDDTLNQIRAHTFGN